MIDLMQVGGSRGRSRPRQAPVPALFAGLLIAMISASAPAGVTNAVQEKAGAPGRVVNPTGPVEKEYQEVLAQDDATQDQIQKWSQEADAATSAGDPQPKMTLRARISQRLQTVKKSYDEFLDRHPDHARARLAYGSFLNDTGQEEGAAEQWDKARILDPSNPAAWNNLANYYGHRSPVKKAFPYYEKAIELDPNEAVYYWNFATTVYLFRPDVREYYSITEDQVFNKALDLYRKAVKLDPNNFVLATDYAESYYGTNPPRWKEGLEAWTQTLRIAHDEVEREGVYTHLARIEIKLGMFDQARKNLDAVTNTNYDALKHQLVRNLDAAIKTSATNAAPALVAPASIERK
jgi:tetratricopeptide (TPR) repeat protein